MALIQPKQIAGGVGGVRTRIPADVTLLIADGFQYVVHVRDFPIQGEVVLEGDGELVIHG